MATGVLRRETNTIGNAINIYDLEQNDYQNLLLGGPGDVAREGIEALRGKVLVVKLGGSTLEHQRGVIEDIIRLRAAGAYPVLVHGGGPYINEWLQKLNIQPRFENGLRVTDRQTLEIVRMVLLGQLNPRLVLMTSQIGGRAVGLSGTDGGMIRAHIADTRLGFVGEIDRVDATPIWNLLVAGYIPIIAPLGEAEDGTCLNINADLVASEIAGALGADHLLFLSNVPGIRHSNGELIAELTGQQARRLIEDGVITGGMIPKVQACADALSTVPYVHILDGSEPHGLVKSLLAQGTGTRIARSF